MWEQAAEEIDPDTPHIVQISPYDQCDIAPDMSKFLLRRASQSRNCRVFACTNTSAARQRWSNSLCSHPPWLERYTPENEG